MCVHIIPAFLPCVSEFSPPHSQVVSPKHLKVGGPIEPLKAVINKPVGGTCMGSDPGSLLKKS